MVASSIITSIVQWLCDSSHSSMTLCHHRGAQNHSPEHSRSPFLAGGMIFPPGMLDPCQSSRNNWKLISFNTTWLHHKKKIFSLFCIFLSLLPLLACTYLNNAWDLVLWALPLSVCLFKINRFVSPNCKSLWIKASAKWLNVNSVSSKPSFKQISACQTCVVWTTALDLWLETVSC